MSIASEISRLTTDRDNIRAAIVAKGISAAVSHGFDDFALDIGLIPTGSTSSATVGMTTATPSSNATSISFSVNGEPIAFVVQIYLSSGSYLTGASTRYITSVVCPGASTLYSTCIYKSGSNAREYVYTTCTFTYSNGTLTVNSPSSSTAGYFKASQTYRLVYVYNT